ncbi:hypothetical protein ACSNOI_02905 [Actinomadura kijaniata]|uniref:hypothetical protein n=1 Tax=Actinomadura kijaniata TaxID=46161 RepID=UPI003F1E19F6
MVLDVGETLLDDTREWRAWADRLGVPDAVATELTDARLRASHPNSRRPGIGAEALAITGPG